MPVAMRFALKSARRSSMLQMRRYELLMISEQTLAHKMAARNGTPARGFSPRFRV